MILQQYLLKSSHRIIHSVTNYDTASVIKGSASNQIDLIANDVDIEDGYPILYAIVVSPQHGTVKIIDDRTISYTPDPGYFGSDSFVY